MKKLLLLCLFFSSLYCVGQPLSNGTSSAVTSVDQHKWVKRTLAIPRFTDTATANLTANKGIDTAGRLMMTYDGKLWKRIFSPKMWVEVAAGSGGGGSGSVTSVGLTMPSAFNVSGSPVTASGTLAVTGAGTTSQYIRGNATLATFPSDLNSFTNGPGYITNSALTPYLLSADAATTYVPLTRTINGQALSSNLTLNSDNIGEGSTNLYYTASRFNSAFSAKSTTDLSEGTNLYYTAARFNTAFSGKNTDGLTEGSTNLYYTNARFDTRFGTKTTDNLSEGSTNLYHTLARARAAVSLSFTTTGSGAASGSYNNSTGVFTINVPTPAGTAYSFNSPLNESAGVVSIQQANTSQGGYLSSADWNTFNSKQAGLSGTGFVTISGSTISYDNSVYYLASNPNNYITSAALSPYLTSATAASTYQPLDADLTAIAGLSPSNDDIIQRKAGAWVNRTIAQLKTDLSLSGTNTGDQDLSGLAVKANNLSDLTNAATARTNLGGTTIGSNLFTLTNPSALGYLRANADNTVTHRSYANVKVDLSINNLDNTSDANKPVSTAQQTALDGKQNLDADLTTIAGLTATTDNFIQSKSGAWASRTIAQVKTDLGLTGTNSGDQTSIVGITGTTTQFNTALTDNDFATLAGNEAFANKTINGSSNTLINTFTLTTTGSSGAATYNGTTLNIPQYSGGGGSYDSAYVRMMPYVVSGDTLGARFARKNTALGEDTLAFRVAGGDALTSGTLAQFAPTTSAELAGVISNETGTGALVFGTSPTIATPNITTGLTVGGAAATGNILQGNGTNYVPTANTGGWTVLRVSGSNATTTGQSLVDITGLNSGTLTNATLYEVEAVLYVTTSAVTTGTQYAITAGGSGAASEVFALVQGTTTTNAATSVTQAVSGTQVGTFLTTSGASGIVTFKGFVLTRGSGTATIALQHLKVTSGTSTVKIGSVLRYRLAQ